jgi:hypothetical protein
MNCLLDVNFMDGRRPGAAAARRSWKQLKVFPSLASAQDDPPTRPSMPDPAMTTSHKGKKADRLITKDTSRRPVQSPHVKHEINK